MDIEGTFQISLEIGQLLTLIGAVWQLFNVKQELTLLKLANKKLPERLRAVEFFLDKRFSYNSLDHYKE